MQLTDVFVLPADVDLCRVDDLPAATREPLEHRPGDWAVTRPRSRTSSRLVDDELATLLARFREGCTIAAAVAAHAHAAGQPPEQVLESALPALRSFIATTWLAPVGSPAADPIGPTHAVGDVVAGVRIVRTCRVVEDGELHQGVTAEGDLVALKVARGGDRASAVVQLRREADALRRLGGTPAPRLLAEGGGDSARHLVLEWCDGTGVGVRAAELRADPDDGSARRRLAELGVRVVEAYAALHERGVLHGDVHPGNLLVQADGAVRVVDFGLAVEDESLHGATTTADDRPAAADAFRGGVVTFFDPDQARASLAGHPAPPADRWSEQFSLAAVLYLLVTGRPYLDFSPVRTTALRQVGVEPPLPFARHGVTGLTSYETVLRRALAPSPRDRYPTTAALLTALRAATVAAGRTTRTAARGSGRAVVDRAAARERSVVVDLQLRRLRQAAQHGGPRASAGPHASVTFGSAGLALGLLRIAGARHDPDVLADAVTWAERAVADVDTPDAFYDRGLAITADSVGRVSPFHTASGAHAVRAMVGQAAGDPLAVREGVEGFLLATAVADEAGVDLTLGRTGVVLTCLQLRDVVERLPATMPLPGVGERLLARGDALLTGIWDSVDEPGALLAATGGALGVAHGLAGMCLVTEQWCAATGRERPAALDVSIALLADAAAWSGGAASWPLRAGNGRAAGSMTSWCNGAPGQVFLWHAVHERTGDPRHAALAAGAAQQSWEQRDEVASLCCGYAGRAYALLRHHRAGGGRQWLERAGVLADLARRCPTARMPDSLYKGEWGVAVLAADLADPAAARMPLFERDV